MIQNTDLQNETKYLEEQISTGNLLLRQALLDDISLVEELVTAEKQLSIIEN